MIQILLQETANSSMGSSLLMFALIIGVFYFFMLRPQQQKQKKAQAFRDALQMGQKVVTIGGIHGVILGLDEKTVLLQSEGQTKIRLERTAISMEATSGLPSETLIQKE